MTLQNYTIYQKHLVSIDFYEDLSFNKELLKYIDTVNWENSYKTNLMSEMSGWKVSHPLIDKLISWVIKSLVESRPHLNFETYSYHVHEIWVARYNKHDFAYKHSHGTYPFSFVYFVNSFPESSNLCFSESNLDITPDIGKLVIFPGNIQHHVSPNMSDNRVVIAGNIIVLHKNEIIEIKHHE